jgi:hypothetical protein
MWKNGIVAFFKILPNIYPERLKKNVETQIEYLSTFEPRIF